MLTSHTRIMDQYRRRHGLTSLHEKLLRSRLEREDPRDDREIVPGVVVALIATRAAERDAKALAIKQLNELA